MSEQVSEIYENYNDFRPTDSKAPRHSYFDANLGAMIRDVQLSPDDRILEIGSGGGEVLETLRTMGFKNLESFEICEPFRASLRERGFKVYDGNRLDELLDQVPDAHFDALIAMDVLEHIERLELQEFLKKFRRKMKPGAWLMGQVPNSSGLFGHNTYLADYTHVTPFNDIRLLSLLKGCGYSQVSVQDTKLPKSAANQMRSVARAVIFKCAFILSRIVGATPTRLFSHLIMFKAQA